MWYPTDFLIDRAPELGEVGVATRTSWSDWIVALTGRHRLSEPIVPKRVVPETED